MWQQALINIYFGILILLVFGEGAKQGWRFTKDDNYEWPTTKDDLLTIAYCLVWPFWLVIALGTGVGNVLALIEHFLTKGKREHK